MSNNMFIDAVSRLDTDLLTEHLERKGRLQKKLKNKRKINILKWSAAAAACLTLVIAMSALLIPNHGTPVDTNGDTHGEEPVVGGVIDNDFFDTLKDDCGMPTILENYHYHRTESFVKVEITKIYDGLYVRGDLPISSDKGTFVLVECTVIEDFYQNIAKGTTVIIPVLTQYQSTPSNSYTQYDEKVVSELLTEFDSFYIYYGSGNMKEGVYSINDGNFQAINVTDNLCVLSLYEMLPIKDGKVQLNALDEFFENNMIGKLEHEYILGFDKMIYDGQSEAEFEENISKLYNYFVINLNRKQGDLK